MSIEAKLNALGYQLPVSPPPVGSYVNAVKTGNQLHISGGLPFSDEKKITGKVPTVTTVQEAQEAAKMIILNRLAVAKAELGTLDRISKVIFLSGYVNSESNFYDHPTVINAASDLLVEIFGEAGRHARVAMGVAALPLNASVEISLILEID